MGGNAQRRSMGIARVVIGFILLSSVLLAFGVNAYELIGPLAVLFTLGSAFGYILTGKFPKHFIWLLVGLLIGPVLLCWMIQYLLCQLRAVFGSTLNGAILLLLLLGLIAASFFYVRSRLNHPKGDRYQLHTNERRPVLPAQTEGEGESHHAGH